MAERKDKKKVIGEAMTDEQIRAFLVFDAEHGVDRDFHRLEKAYRALRAEDFARFVIFFKEEGGNINAQNTSGQTVANVISQHPRSQDYLTALK